MSSSGILQQPAIEREDVEQIEVLALVFVEPLDLHVEERRGVHRDAAVCFLMSRARSTLFACFTAMNSLWNCGSSANGSSPRSLSRSRSQPCADLRR